MNGIKERSDKAVESILENEKLTADLADDAAEVLLDWGIACVRTIVQVTLGLDEMEAEEAMYGPMRATRRLMRAVNRWLTRYEILGEVGHVEVLQKIIAQAGVIYGRDYIPPTPAQQGAFLAEIRGLTADAPQMILQLRGFVEHDPSATASSLFSGH